MSTSNNIFQGTNVRQCAINPDSSGHVNIPSSLGMPPPMAFYRCAGLKSISFEDTLLVTNFHVYTFFESELKKRCIITKHMACR